MAYSTLYDYYTSQGQTLPSYNSPDRLALAASAGITSGYTGTAAQNTQIVNYLNSKTPTPTSTPPSSNTALTQSQLTPPNQPTVTPPPTDYNNYYSQIVGLINNATTQQNTAQNTYDTSVKDFQTELDTLKNKSTDQTAAEANAGIPGLQDREAELQAQLDQITKTAQAGKLTAEGKTIPMSAITAEENSIDRQASIQGLLVSADLSAVQGKLSLAQNRVNTAISNKYDTIEKDLDYRLKLITANYDNLSAAQKKVADLTSTQLQAAKASLDQQKTEETTYRNQKIQALDGGMTLTDAAKADSLFAQGDTNGAYQILGKYIETSQERGPGTTDTTLSTVDLQRISDLYGVTLPYGTTQAQATNIIQQQSSPEGKLTAQITSFKNSGTSYDKVVSDINSSTQITDKALALKVADQVYGKTTTTDPKLQTATTRAGELRKLGLSTDEIVKNLVSSGYSQDTATQAAQASSTFISGIQDTISAISNWLFK